MSDGMARRAPTRPQHTTPRHTAAAAARVPSRAGSKQQAPADALVAAAQRLNLADESGQRLLKRAPQRWQDEAWVYFGVLPEVTFGAGFLANSVSRVGWFPAVKLRPSDTRPVAFDDLPPEQARRFPTALQEAVQEELDRLDIGGGGLPGLKQALGLNLAVAGEAYLVARDPTDSADWRDEQISVHSSAALTVRNGRNVLREDPHGDPIPLPDDSQVVRIWRRDPQWPALAFSPFKSGLDTAEEIILFSRRLRALAKSGINNGILLVPDEANPPAAPAGDPDQPDQASLAALGAGDDQLTPLEQRYIDAMTTAVTDDGSPVAVAPWMLTARAEYIDRIRHLEFTSQMDAGLLERITHLIRRLAQAIDIPPEALVGITDLNHWSAFLLSDEAFRGHIQPLDTIAAEGVLSGFIRPALIDRGFPPELVAQVMLGQDPTALVVRPNRAQDAATAHAARIISDASFREALGFTDGDAPTEEELLQRYVLGRGIGGINLTANLMQQTGLVEKGSLPQNLLTSGSRDDSGSEGDGDDTTPADPDGGGDPMEGGDPLPDTLAAALPMLGLPSADGTLARLGPDLERIETRLRERLAAAAGTAVNDALRKAGARLRSAAQGAQTAAVRRALDGVPNEQVGPRLMRHLAAQMQDRERSVEVVDEIIGGAVALLLANPAQLLEGAFDGLGTEWDREVAAAQQEIAARLGAVAADPAVAADALATYEARLEGDRAAGWGALAPALAGLTSQRLLDQAPALAAGEAPSGLVPHGTVREALAVAGGNAAPTGPGLANGLTMGPSVDDLLKHLDITVTAHMWVTGAPSAPFEPHQALDGVVFFGWDDPQLTNTAAFPAVPFFFPGDHAGCQCGSVPSLALPAMEVAA